jgi:hypothetical protein
VRGQALLADEDALGLLDDGAGVQRGLKLRGECRVLLAQHHGGDQQCRQVGEREQGELALGRPRAPRLRHHRDNADRVLVIRDGAGQHGAHAPAHRRLAEQRPPGLLDQVLGPDEHLVLEGRDARAFLMAQLEFFQVPQAVVRHRRVPQLVAGVGQHQARAVHGEDRVRGLHNLMHRVLDPHLAEPQLAQVMQGMADIVHRYIHPLAPPYPDISQ